MLGTPHALSMALAKQGPTVKLLDTAESTSALTTYTFSSVNLGDLGATATDGTDILGTWNTIRMPTKKYIAVVIHGENSAITFDVTGVTIGGVAGSERSDRAGATSAINTAIYTWTTASLGGITNTDIAVTWSTAITGCAIGVLLVENAAWLNNAGGTNGVGTGVVSAGSALGVSGNASNMLGIWGSTCATGGSTEQPQFYIGEATSTFSPMYAPTLLYQKSNANFDYAAAWSYAPGYFWSGGFAMNVTWSGTGAGDLVTAIMY